MLIFLVLIYCLMTVLSNVFKEQVNLHADGIVIFWSFGFCYLAFGFLDVNCYCYY
jgi:hypothetical protein